MARTQGDESAEYRVQETQLDLAGEADPDVAYRCRPLGRAALETIFRRNTSIKRGVETTDNIRANQDQLDYVVVGWEGYLASDGQPLDCTREHKLAMIPPLVGTALVTLAMSGVREREAAQRATFPPPA